jgi:hypothetical protein
MLAHCGVDKLMKITHGNISQELMCAMRVHLMNESEMNVFCPAEAKVIINFSNILYVFLIIFIVV